MLVARDVPHLLRVLAEEPGTPRITWYGAEGERVELSSRVLENWVAKTAWLLQDLGAEPGAPLGLALPPHWRTTCWLLAAWALDCEVVTGDDAPDADVLVTDDPLLMARAGTAVAVALPALATAWPGALPAGAVDGASEVRAMPDAMPPVHGGAAALAAASEAARDLPDGARVLTAGRPEHGPAEVLAPLVAGGGLLLVGPGVDAEPLLAQERAVRR